MLSIVKCVIVGNNGVGKSSMLTVYTEGTSTKWETMEISTSSSTRVLINNKEIELVIHDDTNSFDNNLTNVFIICFSFVDRASLLSVRDKWIPQIKKDNPSTPFIIVGTKGDLWESPNLLPQKEVHSIVGTDYYPCSALTNAGITEVFASAAKAAISRENQSNCSVI